MLMDSKWGQVDLFPIGRKFFFVRTMNGHPVGEAVGPYTNRQQAMNAILTGEGWNYEGYAWDFIPEEGRGGRGVRHPSREEKVESTVTWSELFKMAQDKEWHTPEQVGSRVRVSVTKRGSRVRRKVHSDASGEGQKHSCPIPTPIGK